MCKVEKILSGPKDPSEFTIEPTQQTGGTFTSQQDSPAARSNENRTQHSSFRSVVRFHPFNLNGFFVYSPYDQMTTPQAEKTPNPNSLKFTTSSGAFRKEGIAAYSSLDEAENDPLARRLFSVSGVDDVFITPKFVTVSKESSTGWSEVKPEIEDVLSEYLDGEF